MSVSEELHKGNNFAQDGVTNVTVDRVKVMAEETDYL